jgi:hypothetical protein
MVSYEDLATEDINYCVLGKKINWTYFNGGNMTPLGKQRWM